jgi:hypothetical protein
MTKRSALFFKLVRSGVELVYKAQVLGMYKADQTGKVPAVNVDCSTMTIL